jgi:hypothetical protein
MRLRFLPIIALGAMLHAQAPHDPLILPLLAADAGIRGLDVYSTQKMLGNGYHELLMPTAIASRPAAMASLEALDVLGVRWASQRLERHGHRKLARLVVILDAASDAPWAVHNLVLGGKKPPLNARWIPKKGE